MSSANQKIKQFIKRLLYKLLDKPFPIASRISTSVSDNQAYPQVCLDASNDYRFFNQFRRDAIYKQILEHVTETLGKDYLQLIANSPNILAKMEEFKQNDRFGNPQMYDYPGMGMVAPSTLRYVKVLADLQSHFQSLDGMRICEIGVGYGGQCRILNAFAKPDSYVLVDIQPALSLAQRFLDNYILHSALTYQTMNELRAAEYDLVISNYAFTELPRKFQDVYLNKVILNSRRGYITYNEINPAEFHSYKAEELVDLFPGAKLLKEEPPTHPKNCIIVWGTSTSS